MTIPSYDESAFSLVRQCLNAVVTLDAKYPGEWPIESVIIQLRLIDRTSSLESIADADREKFDFGFLGMRFIYEFDGALARDLSDLNTYLTRRFARDS